MSKIIILIVGILLIGFIIWWFLGNHEIEENAADINFITDRQNIDVEVKGGYSPETVILKKDVPATINFTRRDSSNCLDRVVFPDFGINQILPKDETMQVKIDTSQVGEFKWVCGMDMFHGKVVVES
ncbi:cupredoxin domain-containing protein [Bombilactobacillus thymidiniphilus]|uniref:Cupredoxin domain-containing protein n=1 Tax=Bombilactobacillus thymidiniphilus TaxID=2923363 RepID=A0ABY4PD17_9LACO|nr:cupredoxin domain-containing protein [Bombilactobacillus thymidiniphilus]UQS83660.1 cupredoxin domain-containing protein [Bombilactobacillus thymidiniphilus]